MPVQQLQRGETRAASGLGESITLSGPTLAGTLRANSEALVMNAVLNEGKSMEEARGEIELKGKGKLDTWFVVGPRQEVEQ